AVPLTLEQLERFGRELSRRAGRQVEISSRVEGDLLGGAVVTALTGFTLATRKKHGSEMPRAAAGPARP
ncbi:MAG: F0F1 ATP synthase subunit delta, partial [Nitrososphaerota archaeon]|nr:F0F1 ATP synthase subunit delta [Nitrososphaerota archaeon]